MNSTDHLLTSLDDGVLRITINRPAKRNALSLVLLDDLTSLLGDHHDDPSVCCVVITGAGDKSFAAGGDLTELDDMRSEAQARDMVARGQAAMDAIRYFPLPVVAAINGVALGGGAELAVACDMRVAAPGARIGFLQGKLNVCTAWGGGPDLLGLVGIGKGLRLLCSSALLSAAEALEWGLVDALATPEQTLEEALTAFISPFTQQKPHVLRGFKAVASEARRRQVEPLKSIEADHSASAWVHEDHWQAARQALGKATQR